MAVLEKASTYLNQHDAAGYAIPLCETKMKINYPIICYLDRALWVDSGIGMKAMGGRFTPEGSFVYRESSLNEQPGWIIESDGSFIELIPVGKRRTWTRPFAFFWRFTLSEFSVLPKRKITIEELSKRITKVKDKFKEAPIASDLRKHLKKYDSIEMVTEKVLKDWPI